MDILSNFAENLAELMAERNLNAPALAKILKMDRSNVTRYLHGLRLPVFHGFIAIAEFFNVSADVLLGRTDYSSETEFLPVLPFGERLRQVMNETKTTQYRIERDLNISGSSMYNWLFNKTVPTVESLVRLAEYMDVSVDYLLGRVR